MKLALVFPLWWYHVLRKITQVSGFNIIDYEEAPSECFTSVHFNLPPKTSSKQLEPVPVWRSDQIIELKGITYIIFCQVSLYACVPKQCILQAKSQNLIKSFSTPVRNVNLKPYF